MRRIALGFLNVEALIACAFTLFIALFALSLQATSLYIFGWLAVTALYLFSMFLNVRMLVKHEKYVQRNWQNIASFFIALLLPNLCWLDATPYDIWLDAANKYGFNY